MGSSIATPTGVGQFNLGETLKLVGLPSKGEDAGKHRSGSDDELVRGIISVIDDLVLSTIKKRSKEDFDKTRTEVFPQYFAAMRALGDLVRIIVPKLKVELLITESLAEIEKDFRNLGPSTFGSDLSNRGIFTVWILGKINGLAQEIGESTYLENHQGKIDGDSVRKFAINAIWTRFHIDCLIKVMHTQEPILPDVMELIADGLRAAVNAYAWLRQSIDPRKTVSEAEFPQVPWDEEDDQLLADSMRDMDQESL